MRLLFNVLLMLNLILGYAAPAEHYIRKDNHQIKINVDIFLSSTCPHCHKASEFFQQLEQKKSWLIVHRHVVNQDKSALQLFYERLQQQHSTNFSVPAIFFCGSYWTGFIDENTSGKLLLHALNYCHQKIIQHNELNPATMNVLQKWGDASRLQPDKKMSGSVYSTIIITALTDAISPCSLFCFAAFLAFLWLYPSRKWQLIVGGVFLFSLGVVHYVQQVHSTFYYSQITKLRLFEVLVGVLLMLVVFNIYRKKLLNHSMKPILRTFILIPLVVLAVQMYQQTCINFSLVFEQRLESETLLPVTYFFYQAIYQVVYLLPLTLFWLIYLMYSLRLSRYNYVLKTAGCLLFLSIGFILIVYPQWLANLSMSIVVIVASLFLGWLNDHYKNKH